MTEGIKLVTLRDLINDTASVVEQARNTPIIITNNFGRLLSVAVLVDSIRDAQKFGRVLQSAGLSPSWEPPIHFDKQSFAENAAVYVSLMSDNCTPAVVQWIDRKEVFAMIPLVVGVESILLELALGPKEHPKPTQDDIAVLGIQLL